MLRSTTYTNDEVNPYYWDEDSLDNMECYDMETWKNTTMPQQQSPQQTTANLIKDCMWPTDSNEDHRNPIRILQTNTTFMIPKVKRTHSKMSEEVSTMIFAFPLSHVEEIKEEELSFSDTDSDTDEEIDVVTVSEQPPLMTREEVNYHSENALRCAQINEIHSYSCARASRFDPKQLLHSTQLVLRKYPQMKHPRGRRRRRFQRRVDPREMPTDRNNWQMHANRNKYPPAQKKHSAPAHNVVCDAKKCGAQYVTVDWTITGGVIRSVENPHHVGGAANGCQYSDHTNIILIKQPPPPPQEQQLVGGRHNMTQSMPVVRLVPLDESDEESDSQGDEAREKLGIHRRLERHRRDELKQAFAALRDVIPDLSKLERTPKVTILKTATIHVNNVFEKFLKFSYIYRQHSAIQTELIRRLIRLGGNPEIDVS